MLIYILLGFKGTEICTCKTRASWTPWNPAFHMEWIGEKDFKIGAYAWVEGGRKAYSLASKVKVALHTSQLCFGSRVVSYFS